MFCEELRSVSVVSVSCFLLRGFLGKRLLSLESKTFDFLAGDAVGSEVRFGGGLAKMWDDWDGCVIIVNG